MRQCYCVFYHPHSAQTADLFSGQFTHLNLSLDCCYWLYHRSMFKGGYFLLGHPIAMFLSDRHKTWHTNALFTQVGHPVFHIILNVIISRS